MAAGAIPRQKGTGDRKRTDKPKGEDGNQQQRQGDDSQGQEQKRQRNEQADPDQIREMLRYIDIHSLSYDEWIRSGMAIKEALGEAGRPLFVEWSAPYPGNDPEIMDLKWETFGPTDIGAGTTFWQARQN